MARRRKEEADRMRNGEANRIRNQTEIKPELNPELNRIKSN